MALSGPRLVAAKAVLAVWMHPRNALATAVETVGFGAITAGCWRISPTIGLITAGVSLIVLGNFA